MTRISASLLVLLSSLTFKTAIGQTNYGVYYDPDTTSYNPYGNGYTPIRSAKWFKVSNAAWPVFLDWGEYLIDPSDWNSGNQCRDRSSYSYSSSHKQSPIRLTSDKTCDHRHSVSTPTRGKCTKSQPRFYQTAYGLGVDLTKCSIPQTADYSRSDDPWVMREIVVKAPAEHSIKDASTGATRTFAAELQINYSGTNTGSDKGTNHESKIATTSILIDASVSYATDPELEKLIQGWESASSLSYQACGKVYDQSTCSLTSFRLRRELEHEESEALPESPVEQEIEAHHGRDLAEFDKSWACKQAGSYHCWENLYLHTNSHFYYKYSGSLTYPPCTNNVDWHVMQQPLKISRSQLNRIRTLIDSYLNANCELGTVGVKASSNSCNVNVNRPTQSLSKSHNLIKCDAWVEASATVVTNNTTYPSSKYTVASSTTVTTTTSTKNNIF